MKPVAMLGLFAVAGGFAFLLTRKSEPQPPPPSTTQKAPPTPTLPALPSFIPHPDLLATPLDAGLSADEKLAVQKALSKETSTANLLAFASTFDPIFPVAASVLRSRALALS